MKYIYIQGNFVSEEKATLSIRNRAFRFGDGIFETIRIENSKPYNFEFHLKRLKSGCEAIKLQTPDVTTPALELVEKNNLKQGFLRISVSRGEGSKGYLPTSTATTLVIETIEGIEPSPSPAKLYISSYKAHRIAPAKTMNGLNYTLALMEAQEYDCDNALLLDEHKNICETASGNIFWFKNGRLYTPADTLPLIPGSIREKIISLHGAEEVTANISELETAEEIFMTNVNCLVQPFTERNGKSLAIKKLIEDDIKSTLG